MLLLPIETDRAVGGGTSLDLNTPLPSSAKRRDSALPPYAEFHVDNTGGVDAYFRLSGEATPTALKIPAGEQRVLGPLPVAKDLDILLDVPATGSCIVATFYQGAR